MHTIRLQHSSTADAGAPLLSKRHEASNFRGQNGLAAGVIALWETPERQG